MEAVTQKRIAEALGVSRRLVTYALNGTGRVNIETRKKILEEANRLSYRPNRAAHALATGRSNLIAYCLPSNVSAFSVEVLGALEDQISATSYDLVVTKEHSPETGEHATALPMGLGQVDGIMLLNQPPPTHEETILHGGFKLVLMGSWMGDDPEGYDTVRIDFSSATEEAIRHLHDQGCRRIAYVASELTVLRGEARYEAYLREVDKFDQEPIAIVVSNEEDIRHRADIALSDYVASNAAPDGLFCSNDEIAIGCYRALRKLKLRIPEDVAVIGCDGINETIDMYPPLTTISRFVDKMVAEACLFMIEGIENPEREPRHVTIPGTVVYRESSQRRQQSEA